MLVRAGGSVGLRGLGFLVNLGASAINVLTRSD